MSEQSVTAVVTTEQVRTWLAGKIAERLQVDPADVSHDDFFDSFGLDSAEALVLADELEAWLGFEIAATALWYHPTIAELAAYLTADVAGAPSDPIPEVGAQQ